MRSFQPDVTDVGQRLLNSYAIEVARVDTNGDGVISFSEVPINGTSDGGLLAPRFAPSRRAYVLEGNVTFVNPFVPASVPIDADLR